MSELNKITMSEANDYLHCLRIIKSEEMLAKMQIADFPHLKESARNKVRQAVLKKSQLDLSEKAITTQQFAEIMRGF